MGKYLLIFLVSMAVSGGLYGLYSTILKAETAKITYVALSIPDAKTKTGGKYRLMRELEKQGMGFAQFQKMREIARRESGWNWSAKNHNTNGTTDTGYFQINDCWREKAKEMGLDIDKPEDNIKMAVYIFKTEGSAPWVSMRYE